MDDFRFDALARSLSEARSRRGIARVLGGLAAGGMLGVWRAEVAIAGARPGGAPCSKGTQCQTGKCLRNETCSCDLAQGITCRSDQNPCTREVCSDRGVCKYPPNRNKNGTTCDTGRVCCDGDCLECCTADDCPATQPVCTTASTCAECPADTCSRPTACGTSSSGAPCFCLTSTEGQTMCVSSDNVNMSCMAAGCSDDECVDLFGKPAICVDFTGCSLGTPGCTTRCLTKCDAA